MSSAVDFGMSRGVIPAAWWFVGPDDGETLQNRPALERLLDRWPGGAAGRPRGADAHECLQAVLWNGTVRLIPLGHDLPDGLVAVEIADQPPSELVPAWREHDAGPLTRSFVSVATTLHRR